MFMQRLLKKKSNLLFVSLTSIIGLLCLGKLWQISSATNLGGGDFVGYWSATYLLQQGENPYDPVLMGNVQHDHIQTGADATIMSWNPPVLFIVLLPLSWMPYPIAKFIWLLINITLLLISSLMLIRLYFPEKSFSAVLLFLLFVVFFPQAISSIFMGQVTFLVLLGLVASLVFIKRGQWFWAGAALILTLVKPHLVILPLFYLLTYMFQRRQWAGWAGLFVAGLLSIGVLLYFRPTLVNDFIGLMKISPSNWFTPTLGGLLSYLGVSEAFRYIILLFLPLPFILTVRSPEIEPELAIALLALITIPVTFFGWSYDQIILLMPIAQIFAWAARAKDKTSSVWLAVFILPAMFLIFYQHIYNRNDVFYLWFPFFWWLTFGLTWRVLKRKNLQNESN